MLRTSDEATLRTREDVGAQSTVEAVESQSSGEPPEQLSLLDDEYARAILMELCGGPQQGRQLVAACGFSRSTVYRRLNRLEAAGLVGSDLCIDPDGNHCKEFSLLRERLDVSIEDGMITVTARPATDD